MIKRMTYGIPLDESDKIRISASKGFIRFTDDLHWEIDLELAKAMNNIDKGINTNDISLVNKEVKKNSDLIPYATKKLKDKGIEPRLWSEHLMTTASGLLTTRKEHFKNVLVRK